MSLIVTVRTPEGAVMAADSRTTWSTSVKDGKSLKTTVGIHFSDTANKLFLCGRRFGVSTCGDASIQGRSISAWMDMFQRNEFSDAETVIGVANRLGVFFAKLRPLQTISFHVVGYERVDSTMTLSFYEVIVSSDGSYDMSGPERGCGAHWAGEVATMSRLIKDCYIADSLDIETISEFRKEKNVTDLGQETLWKNATVLAPTVSHYPEASIRWRSFTLQEAIDFVLYAIRTTIATLRFQSLPVTVGEPIDVLVIKPSEAFWLSKKELHL